MISNLDLTSGIFELLSNSTTK
jgi:hypothetical protein